VVKVIALEDDHDYAEVIHALFQGEAWTVETTEQCADALDRIRNQMFDLCVTTSRLAARSEYSFCAQVRQHSSLPVLVLLDSDHLSSQSWFLDEGADAVLAKPFHPRDLRSTARAMLRRVVLSQKAAAAADELVAHSIRLSIGRRQAMVGARVIHLAPREFSLLHILMANRGCILTRSQLAVRAWGVEFDGADREVDVYVRRLRNKIETNPQRPEFLLTERGFGYRFRR
jgi:DNA-binding response OmpR family regulator